MSCPGEARRVVSQNNKFLEQEWILEATWSDLTNTGIPSTEAPTDGYTLVF